ncbi:hypothetical protein AGLY_008983 [Aphis glycines]|uniref:Uncharacterized protein n=1 Tax=Aphis glycines TaxID=307491 RepID=A0A6G0TJA4_APHGL|nr:hypothetical protein AGLY_008983 [Aphis glycines]
MYKVIFESVVQYTFIQNGTLTFKIERTSPLNIFPSTLVSGHCDRAFKICIQHFTVITAKNTKRKKIKQQSSINTRVVQSTEVYLYNTIVIISLSVFFLRTNVILFEIVYINIQLEYGDMAYIRLMIMIIYLIKMHKQTNRSMVFIILYPAFVHRKKAVHRRTLGMNLRDVEIINGTQIHEGENKNKYLKCDKCEKMSQTEINLLYHNYFCSARKLTETFVGLVLSRENGISIDVIAGVNITITIYPQTILNICYYSKSKTTEIFDFSEIFFFFEVLIKIFGPVKIPFEVQILKKSRQNHEYLQIVLPLKHKPFFSITTGNYIFIIYNYNYIADNIYHLRSKSFFVFNDTYHWIQI